MDKNKEMSIDDLSMIIQKEFHNINEKLEKLDVLEKGQEEIREKLIILERGQEDIKLRQDNCAYRFELKEQEETLENHDRRIMTLEKKVLMAS